MDPSPDHDRFLSPSDLDSSLARELGARIGAHLEDGDGVRLELKAGATTEAFTIPAPTLKLLHRILTGLGRGQPLLLMPDGESLSISDAASFLNVSRPYLVRLLDEGLIPGWGEGPDRRILASDLSRYWEEWKGRRLAALDELAALSQDLDMGYGTREPDGAL